MVSQLTTRPTGHIPIGGCMKTPEQKHIDEAIKFNPEKWATHIAVKYDCSKVESAYYSQNAREYLDGEPVKDQWNGVFSKKYWVFIPIVELNK